MTYAEFRERSHFTRDEVLAMAYGRLVEDPPEQFEARLPLPPMLMVDRVSEISRGGARGRIVAEREVRVDDWFFHCHFLGDPVQPGCLGVDAIWQLIGLYCAWSGALGTGRALGCAASGSAVAIGDAKVLVDDQEIYEIKRAKVGVFRDIGYPDYPWPSRHSRGGRMEE